MKTEHRKSVRRTVQHTAWIAQQGKPLIGCVLADISEHGARLAVEDVESVPDEFMLFLSRRGTPRRLCRVARRSENEVGIMFTAPEAPKANARVKTMLARQASLQPDMPPATQPDMNASDEAPITPAATSGKDEKEPA
jgi:hypothetical protein